MTNTRKSNEQLLFEAVKSESDELTAKKIVHGNTQQPSSEDNALWVKTSMHRLEKHFDRPTIKRIRMNCQCGQEMDEKLEFIKELLALSSNLEEFANHDRARAAGLSFNDGVLYLEFPTCPCPMLAEVDKLETDTWCQCTTGYSKVLFEQAFGCKVEVELLKSVKMGDDKCLMTIVPCNPIWN